MISYDFDFQLVQRFCLDDKHGSQVTEADFYNSFETLSRIAQHSRQAPEGSVIFINNSGTCKRLDTAN